MRTFDTISTFNELLSVVNAIPVCLLILKPDAPRFTIVAATESYLESKYLAREQTVGKPLFETLTGNPHDPKATGVKNLSFSLEYVLAHKQQHRMENQRYDVWNPYQQRFEKRVWRPLNRPVLNESGTVQFILHWVEDITEKVQLEEQAKQDREALERSRQSKEESQYEMVALFEQSQIAIAIIARENLTFRKANSFYGTLVGRKPEQIIGKPLHEALPELAGQGFDALLSKIIETETPFLSPEVAVQLRREQGMETIFVNVAYQPLRDNNGSVSGVLVIAADITVQVLARQQLAESEARFRSLIQEAPVATCLFTGPEMKIEVANQMMIEVWGKGSAVLGLPLAEALPELRGQHFLPLLDELFRTGESYEVKGGRADLVIEGKLTTFYFDYTFKPLKDSSGKIYAIMDMAIDVTTTVIAQAKMEESEINLRNAINSAELGFYEVNLETGKIEGNARFYEIFESNPDFNWENTVKFIHPDDKPARDEALHKAFETGMMEYEVRIIKKDGSIHWIKVAGRILGTSGEKGRKLVGVIQDITAQKLFSEELERKVIERTRELEQANVRLRHTNTELNQFAYIASHDLQEPLRKVRTYTGLLESAVQEMPIRAKEYLERIKLSSVRMQNLIHDVLNFSALKNEIDIYEQVDLNEVIKAVLVDFELLVEQTGAIVTTDHLPVLEGSRLQMNQLFTNLLSNSLKFIDKNRKPDIFVTARLLEGNEIKNYPDLNLATAYYEIAFRDNGIGFEQQYADKIFIMLQRLHNKSVYPGTGIGLAMCRKIVQVHNGTIHVKSVPGVGTTFYIILPAP